MKVYVLIKEEIHSFSTPKVAIFQNRLDARFVMKELVKKEKLREYEVEQLYADCYWLKHKSSNLTIVYFIEEKEVIENKRKRKMEYNFNKLDKDRAIKAANKFDLQEPNGDVSLAELFVNKK